MQNKDVIDKMQNYFLQQDPASVARILAAVMIDLNRLSNIKLLGKDEKASLLNRLKLNAYQVQKFARGDIMSDIKIIET